MIKKVIITLLLSTVVHEYSIGYSALWSEIQGAQQLQVGDTETYKCINIWKSIENQKNLTPELANIPTVKFFKSAQWTPTKGLKVANETYGSADVTALKKGDKEWLQFHGDFSRTVIGTDDFNGGIAIIVVP